MFAIGVIVLWSHRLEETVGFYEALGLPLKREDHGDGPIHYTCELGPTHFAIFGGKHGDAVAREIGGCTQLGFQVSDVDAAFAVVEGLGVKVVRGPENMPWGRTALVCDPDGRPVELSNAA